MAHLWTRDTTETWCIIPLKISHVVLSEDASRPVRRPIVADEADSVSLVATTYREQGDPEWIALAKDRRQLSVNGMPLETGMRVLRDRDELRVGRENLLFFSTERLAEVVPFPGGARPVMCIRCKQELEAGTAAVACPGKNCGLWYHETEELPCWTYSDTCSMCSRETALDARYSWTPADL